MTSIPITEPLVLTPPRARPRKWTGLREFLLVGGLTPLLFPLSWLLRRGIGLDAAELGVSFTMFYAAYVINDPHFAVTYLLFYKDARARIFGDTFPPAQRARYIVAGVVVPLVVAAWGLTAIAVKSAVVMGWLIQLMFLLVGWHYCKQGFGVMAVLASRRGVTFLPRERLAILAHCLSGWAYAWASPYDPGYETEEKGVVYTTIRHPHGLLHLTLFLAVGTGFAVAVLMFLKWRREKRLPLFTPLMALWCSVWPWSIYSNIDPLVRYMVPALHSVQYLYFVWLLKSNQAREREQAPWFERSARVRLGILVVSSLALGWVLFHGAPWALDDGLVPPRARDTDLGPTPYFAAIYAFVNIHHYFMDNVIWRRENPLTRYLKPSVTMGPQAAPNPGPAKPALEAAR